MPRSPAHRPKAGVFRTDEVIVLSEHQIVAEQPAGAYRVRASPPMCRSMAGNSREHSNLPFRSGLVSERYGPLGDRERIVMLGIVVPVAVSGSEQLQNLVRPERAPDL